jgi:hypothetical protein
LVVKKWWTSESIDRVEQQKVSINKLFEEIFYSRTSSIGHHHRF